jgi:hypothetical protein
MKPDLSNLDRLALEKAIKETPTLKVGVSIPRSMNLGFSDLPLFNESDKQGSLFDKKGGKHGRS